MLPDWSARRIEFPHGYTHSRVQFALAFWAICKFDHGAHRILTCPVEKETQATPLIRPAYLNVIRLRKRLPRFSCPSRHSLRQLLANAAIAASRVASERASVGAWPCHRHAGR